MKKTVITLVVWLFSLALSSGCPDSAQADSVNFWFCDSSIIVTDVKDNPFRYEFTPTSSGLWSIYTSNCYIYTEFDERRAQANKECTPLLSVFDQDGQLIASDSGNGSKLQLEDSHYSFEPYYHPAEFNLNSRITTWLEAGTTYYAEVFFGSRRTEFFLTIAPEQIEPLSNSGGSVRISADTYYDFTPDQTGIWSFQSSDIGRAYPLLAVFDQSGELLGFDHDRGELLHSSYYAGIEPQARLDVNLVVGQTYTVYAGFVDGNINPYTLEVYPLQATPLPIKNSRAKMRDIAYHLFCPDKSGLWWLDGRDTEGNSQTSMYNAQGEFLGSITSGSYNRLYVSLEAGAAYYIYFSKTPDRLFDHAPIEAAQTLLIDHLPSLPLPGMEGTAQVNQEVEFVFYPEHSGRWEFLAPPGFSSDPSLAIFDAQGRRLTLSDRERKSWRASADLEAGARYSIYAGFTATYRQDPYSLQISLSDLSIPPEGGTAQVLRESDYAFYPNQSGRWLILAANDEDGCQLNLLNQHGKLIDSSRGIRNNNRLLAKLEAGSRYTIQVLSSWKDTLSPVVLSVMPMPVSSLPAKGGVVQVSQEQEYVFSPGQTGNWEFVAARQDGCEPNIVLFDAQYQQIVPAFSGDYRRSKFDADLESGMTYIIHARYLDNKICNYSLTVSHGN